MVAAAMAYSFGVDLDNIRHGLRTFDTSYFQAPGRMNVYDEHPFKVILDYGHNPAALKAMAALADQLEVKGRRLCVVAMPGDRRDEDIVDGAAALAGHFDHFICKADDRRRGRGHDEVPQMMRQALIDCGTPDEAISIIPDEVEAVTTALEMAAPGDLLVIFGDDTTRCWKQIIYFNSDGETSETEATPKTSPADTTFEDMFDSDQNLIRDERGVRLAREISEDAD